MFEISYSTKVIIFLALMWYFAYRVFRRKIANEEMSTISMRVIFPPKNERGWFDYYKPSLVNISKNARKGRAKSLFYAFLIGYTVGKMGKTIVPKQKEDSSCTKGGADNE